MADHVDALPSLAALIIDKAYNAFVAIDDNGMVTYWNPCAERMFGWAKEEVMDRPLADTIIPERYRDKHRSGLLRYKETGAGQILNKAIQISAMSKDGREFPVELAVFPVEPGTRIAFGAFIADISERAQLEQELRETHDQALESSRLKSNFVATISHEIRTPLSGLLGMAELLTMEELGEENDQLAQHIFTAAKSLLMVVNDLLDFSKMEAGRFELQANEFSIRTVIDDVLHSIGPSVHEKRLKMSGTVDNKVPDRLLGDDLRIRQIMLNLAHNAVKFTEKGTVSLQVTLVSREADTAVIRCNISDTGIGIPDDIQKRLFEPFVQADRTVTRRFGGTGLGLSISRGLVNLMGGEIGIISQLNQGSTFWFTIPLKVPQ